MPLLVTKTATLKCSFGTAESVFDVVPHQQASGVRQPLATVQDFEPNENIRSFTLCTSPANPLVASAGAPQPCVPVVTAPWAPGSPAVNIDGRPALTSDSRCSCQWGGTIEITSAGQGTVAAGGGAPQAASTSAKVQGRGRVILAGGKGATLPALTPVERSAMFRPPAEQPSDTVELALSLEIDPASASAEQARFVLSAADGSLRSEKTVRDDRVPGNASVELLFEGLDPGKRFTLDVVDSPGAPPHRVFEGVPYPELSSLQQERAEDPREPTSDGEAVLPAVASRCG